MIKSTPRDAIITKTGQIIRVRRLRTDDAALLVDLYDHMSPESRFRRYNQSLEGVDPSTIRREALQIAQDANKKNLGLIALADVDGVAHTPVAAARLVETAPQEAEVAISVRDEYQNQGIGTQLMRLLADEARGLDYQRLVATIRNDNPAIWRVFNRLPYHVVRTAEGAFSDIEILLTEARNKELELT